MTGLIILAALTAFFIVLNLVECLWGEPLAPYDEEHEKAIKEVRDAERLANRRKCARTKKARK